MTVRSTLVAYLVASLCAACSQEGSPLMAPGQDCVGCHDGGEAQRWTVAGTWWRGSHVTVTDASGKSVTMRGNRVGNFYTAESLTPPLSVSVEGVPMPSDALRSTSWASGSLNYGGCNLCHGASRKIESWDVQAPLMSPGRDCLRCHNGGTAARFTVAGTWKGPGRVIRVVDGALVTKTLATNEVGNFFTSDPLTFPLTQVWVDNEEMSREKLRGVMHGSCNFCHGNGGEAED